MSHQTNSVLDMVKCNKIATSSFFGHIPENHGQSASMIYLCSLCPLCIIAIVCVTHHAQSSQRISNKVISEGQQFIFNRYMEARNYKKYNITRNIMQLIGYRMEEMWPARLSDQVVIYTYAFFIRVLVIGRIYTYTVSFRICETATHHSL